MHFSQLYYIESARATMPISLIDAAEYYNLAIEVVSRFEDEIVERGHSFD